MKGLPEDVRRKAIKYTNEMMTDSNVRHHKDFIILKAIEKAKLWAVYKDKEGSLLY